MAITASTVTSGQTLEEFRQEFNRLISDVNDIKDNSTFTSSLIFEGSSADDFESTWTQVNPTADRTITFPDETGTVLTTATLVGATTINITDNESTNENNAIVFVADADLDGGDVYLESDGDLTYNPSSSTVTATTFSGALTGNATTATTLASAQNFSITGDVTAANVSFDGSGAVALSAGTVDATTVKLTATNTTDSTHYPAFVDTATGSEGVRTDTGLTYNPNSGLLTSTTFAGALTGNASTATALETARTIGGTSFDGTGNISVALATQATTFTSSANDSANETVYPVFVDGQTGAQDAETDTGLTYNPSTGIITSTGYTGTLQTAAQANITSVGTLTGLVIANDGNIGSASDTDSIAIDSTGNVTVSQNLLVSGTLEVQGATTTISSTNSVIADSLIELNTGASSNANDLGFIFERGSTGDNAALLWVEASDKFKLGTTTAIGTATGSLTVATGTLIANVEGDVTGDITGDVTGNADTATALETARTIGGTSFDGTANIAVALAATATALASARTIGGTSFDGTSNIAVALSTEATTFTSSANDSANETVYPVFVDGQTGAQDAETDSGLTYNPSTGIITSTGYTGTLQTAAQANITSVGTLTGVTIANDGNIGSASDTDAMAISSGGIVSFSQGIEPAEYVHLVGDEKELRWYNGSNYVGFKASTSLSGNQIWVLPTSDGASSGDALVTDASGNLSFSGVVGANAQTVTIADESSDTSCFPLFATGASGNLAPKTAAGLTFNSATDTLTATAFAGPLTGNVTGNVSGTAATVTDAAQSAITSLGTLTSLVVADDGNIGSASDLDAMAIASDGKVTFSQQATFTGGLKIADGGNVGANSDTDAIAISAGGLVTFSQDIHVEDDIIMDSDGAILSMGESNEIQVIHELNSGVLVKHNATGDGSTVRLTLETGEENIELDDVIGSMQYRAPAETTGTDANLVAAAIEAISEGDFSASNNATKLSFMTGISEAASEAMSLSSTGKMVFPNKEGGDNILLNGTDANGTDAGDDVTLNGTDGASANANSNILIEEAEVLTTQTDYNDMHRMMGHMDDTATHMFPNKFRLLNSSGAVLATYHCAGTQDGVTT